MAEKNYGLNYIPQLQMEPFKYRFAASSTCATTRIYATINGINIVMLSIQSVKKYLKNTNRYLNEFFAGSNNDIS